MTNLYGIDVNPYLFSLLVGIVILCIFLVSNYFEVKYQNRQLYDLLQRNSKMNNELNVFIVKLKEENIRLNKIISARNDLWNLHSSHVVTEVATDDSN